MKILMFGRGVIAVAYGWALERAGHEVEFFVRPGRAAEYGLAIDLELLDEGRVVLGQLDPAGSAFVAVENQDGSTTDSADDLGRFRFGAVRGPVRLRVTVGEGVVVLTPWITW